MLEGVIVPAGVFLNGILAGIFLCSCLVEHAARTLSGSHWIAYKQAKEAVFGPVMPVLFGVVLISSIVVAVMGPHRFAFSTTCVLLILALLITVLIHLPLNKLFQGWSTDALPDGWDHARDRWRKWNWVRCAFAVAAFCATLLKVG